MEQFFDVLFHFLDLMVQLLLKYMMLMLVNFRTDFSETTTSISFIQGLMQYVFFVDRFNWCSFPSFVLFDIFSTETDLPNKTRSFRLPLKVLASHRSSIKKYLRSYAEAFFL